MATTKPGRRAENPEARMPLMDHIRELRNRMLKAILGMVVATVIGFVFFDPIWEVLQRPYCQLPAAQELRGDGCSLGVFRVFDSFFIHLKVGLIVGIVASSPIWLYQIWAFVTPGLRRNERRWTFLFLATSIPLFFGGSVLAYFILDKGLALLMSFVPENVVPILGISEYLSFIAKMLLVFGVAFELPLLVVILNLAGVLSYARIARWRRMIMFLVFIFAAVATPGGDPFSMLALGASMIVLFELAAQLARLNDRRKAARDAASPLANLSDDEASPLDLDDAGDLDDDRR